MITDDNSMQSPLIDDETLAELQDVMESGFADLVNRFLDDLPVQLGHLRCAVQENAADGLYRIAHKLGSSCGNLGAMRLTERVRRLEQAGRQNALNGVAELLAETQAIAEQTMIALRARLD